MTALKSEKLSLASSDDGQGRALLFATEKHGEGAELLAEIKFTSYPKLPDIISFSGRYFTRHLLLSAAFCKPAYVQAFCHTALKSEVVETSDG